MKIIIKILILLLYLTINSFSQTLNPYYIGESKEVFKQIKFKATVISPHMWSFTTWNDSMLRGKSLEYYDEFSMGFSYYAPDTICTVLEYNSFIVDSISWTDTLGVLHSFYMNPDSMEQETLTMFENIIQKYQPNVVLNRVPPALVETQDFDFYRGDTLFAKGQVLWNRNYSFNNNFRYYGSTVRLNITYAGIRNESNLIVPNKIDNLIFKEDLK